MVVVCYIQLERCSMPRYKVSRVKEDLVGKIFGGFTVKSKLPNGDNGRVIWGCICNFCNSGNIFKVRDDSLKKNKFGCNNCTKIKNGYATKFGSESRLWRGTKDISLTFYNRIKRQSIRKSRTLEFSVSIEYLQKLLEDQKYKCAISGIDLVTDSDIRTTVSDRTISLDRINSSLGYVEGNVHWVHKTVNIMKWSLELDDFLFWCLRVCKHQNTASI